MATETRLVRRNRVILWSSCSDQRNFKKYIKAVNFTLSFNQAASLLLRDNLGKQNEFSIIGKDPTNCSFFS